MTRILTLLAALAVAVLARPVAAADPTPLLAVLEFDAPDQSATIDELMLVTNEFRGAVIATVLASAGMTIMAVVDVAGHSG